MGSSFTRRARRARPAAWVLEAAGRTFEPRGSMSTGYSFLIPLQRLFHTVGELHAWRITEFAFRLFDAEVEVQAQELQACLGEPGRFRGAAAACAPLHHSGRDARQPERHLPARPGQIQAIGNRLEKL